MIEALVFFVAFFAAVEWYANTPGGSREEFLSEVVGLICALGFVVSFVVALIRSVWYG